MTIFEYLSVAVSIVLSLATVRLLNGMPHLTASQKGYWVHTAWVIMVAINNIVMWWNMWAFTQVEDWIFPEFALLLLWPVTAYYIAATLIPDAPATIESWRSHFFQVRRRLYFALMFLFTCFIVTPVVLLQTPLLHPQRLGEAAMIVLGLIGVSSEDPRVHGVLVLLALCGFAAVIAIFFLRPGGFASS